MTDDLYTPDNEHLLKVKKGSMSAWRNADAKIIAAETQKMDILITGELTEPITVVTPSGANSYLPKYIESGYSPGMWTEMLKFQTGMQLYPSMGKCTTVDNVDINGDAAVGTYQKTMALRTAQTPTWQGRHWERENTTDAESERIDILGMLCRSHHIECSEAQPLGVQLLNWGVAFTLNTGTDDIARSQADDKPFRWNNFAFTVLLPDAGSTPLEADIIGWSFDIQNTIMFIAPDSSGYYQKGKYIPQTFISTTLEIFPYGKNAFELIRTPLGSYTTDLDLTVLATRTTLIDEIKWTHDKCYCYPFTIKVTKDPGIVERYFLRMVQLDTGSIVPIVAGDYDDDYYET